jgi:parvulin-like peptidyl-prolyl isomerase
MRKILQEPLLQFLLIGLGFFILYGLVNKQKDGEDIIVIDTYDVDNIIASWEMQWKRLPTDEELKSLIQQNIKQEIFYQEALKMKLDHNDEIIKRRLAQKMQFLSNDIVSMSEPTIEELTKYYDSNFENYLTPYSFSFYQIVFSQDNRKDPKRDAENELIELGHSSIEQSKKKGDKLPFPFFFENVDEGEINRQLGLNFSKSLETLDTGAWHGPIQSGFGYHLVYLIKKTGPQIPDFETVKKEVKRDMEYENQKKMNELIFEELKKNYTIKFDLDASKFDDTFIDYLNEKDKS